MLNRLAKLIISVSIFILSSIAGVIFKLLGKKTSGTLVILTYHSVKPEQHAKFKKQMDRLIDIGKPVFADIKGDLPKGVHHVAVTFDDGFQSVLENALPTLQRAKIPATLFVPVGYLGSTPGWIKKASHENARETLLTAEQLQRLPHDWVKIGSHCITHPNLRNLEPEQVKKELLESKSKLEELLGNKIELLSFPYNSYNDRIMGIARQVGYRRVFANVPIHPTTETDPFLYGRIDVSPDDWSIEYWLKLKGLYRWLPFAIAIKRKLISQERTN